MRKSQVLTSGELMQRPLSVGPMMSTTPMLRYRVYRWHVQLVTKTLAATQKPSAQASGTLVQRPLSVVPMMSTTPMLMTQSALVWHVQLRQRDLLQPKSQVLKHRDASAKATFCGSMMSTTPMLMTQVRWCGMCSW